MLTKFNIALFRITLKPLTLVVLPEYKGSTLRGGFGKALKRVTCLKADGQACEGCQKTEECIYAQIFETPIPKENTYFRGMSRIPHPFVLETPLEKNQAYEPGERIRFTLILIGRAIGYIHWFIYALSELGREGIGKRIEGRRGRYQLEIVENLPSLDAREGKVLYTHDSQEISGGYMPIGLAEVLDGRPKQLKEITLEFLTPARIQEKGKLQHKLSFASLLKRLLQRISMLAYFHCGERLDIDYSALIEQAEKEVQVVDDSLEWFELRRYSRRQEQTVSLGGLVGKITFEGNMQDYLPFIYLGEYLHVGKNTAFGLGKYQMVGEYNNID